MASSSAYERTVTVFAIAIALLVACVPASSREDCESTASLEFVGTVRPEDCVECAIVKQSFFLDRHSTVAFTEDVLLSVDACALDRVFLARDGVAIELSNSDQVQIQALMVENRSSRRQLLAVILVNGVDRELVSLVGRDLIGSLVPLFDLETEDEIARFTSLLNRSEITVRSEELIRGPVHELESQATKEARRLLDRAATRRQLYERLLDLAREGKAGTEEYADLLMQLELSEE